MLSYDRDKTARDRRKATCTSCGKWARSSDRQFARTVVLAGFWRMRVVESAKFQMQMIRQEFGAEWIGVATRCRRACDPSTPSPSSFPPSFLPPMNHDVDPRSRSSSLDLLDIVNSSLHGSPLARGRRSSGRSTRTKPYDEHDSNTVKSARRRFLSRSELSSLFRSAAAANIT